MAEALAYAYQERHQADIRIARIFNTYGPRMGSGDGRVVSNFVAAALARESLNITGDGLATRSFQYVDDCLRGLHELMNSGYSQGPVNIGNNAELSIGKLAELVADLVAQTTGEPRSNITFGPRPVDDPLTRCPDISLANEVLGWSPIVPLQEGLAKTIQWHIKSKIDSS